MPDVAAKLFPNITTVIVQLLSTGVMLFLFRKLLWNYVLDFLNQRADAIEKNMTDAKEAKDQALVYLEKSEKQAQEAAKQYRDIVNQANEDAKAIKQQALSDAQAQAQDKLEQARRAIESERAQAQSQMKEEIIGVALDAATKVMNKDMDTPTNNALIEDFVNQVVN